MPQSLKPSISLKLFRLKVKILRYTKALILSFEIDKEYIENELEKYKLIEIKGPYLTDNEYKDNTERYYAVNDIDLNKAGFKFYAIGKGSGEYGIAVSDKTNRILYYSITLD